jgi:hypothetical protein
VQRTIVLKGHVISSNTIRVDEPLPSKPRDVEVILRVPDEEAGDPRRIVDLLMTLPPGKRSKQDIDAQIDEGRGPWVG